MAVENFRVPPALEALKLALHPGQPLVVAFADDALLKECPSLNKIRAELRGLGAALILVAHPRMFWFRPDDELVLNGDLQELEPGATLELRLSLGLTERQRNARELSVVLLAGDGHVVSRHTLVAEDGLSALAHALGTAGRTAVTDRSRVQVSRRELVLMSLVAAFALLATEGCHRPVARHDAPVQSAATRAHTRRIALNVNGQRHELDLEPRVSLLDALRERLGLTGSKKGCDHGQCGACTVHIAGRRVNACLTLAVMVGDAPVTTIEGLADGDTLHPMQAAFVADDALQCGYCTPGQIMSALGLVRERRAQSDAEVREEMSGNLCRCGAYTNIVAAIQRARAASLAG